MDLQGVQIHPYGMRAEGDSRYFIFQVWELQGSIYDLTMYFVKDEGGSPCQTHALRSKYYAVTLDKLEALLAQAGFDNVKRLDGRFFQPIVVGTRPRSS